MDVIYYKLLAELTHAGNWALWNDGELGHVKCNLSFEEHNDSSLDLLLGMIQKLTTLCW